MSKAEEIARMAGKTTFRMPEQGAFGGIFGDPDADVKHALGVTRRRVGETAVAVLQLKYAQMLGCERWLRRGWDKRVRSAAKESGMPCDRQAVAAARMGAALAIRKFAGATMVDRDIEEYAWLARCSVEAVTDNVRDCTQWLDELCRDAKKVFEAAMNDDECEVDVA